MTRRRQGIVLIMAVAALLLIGCAGNPEESAAQGAGPSEGSATAQGSGGGSGEADPGSGANMVEVDVQGGPDGPEYRNPELPGEFLDQDPPRTAGQFSTDFSRATVSFSEIISGGPPKDGIPSIDNPRFVDTDAAKDWLSADESVLVVSRNDETHIYPVQILMFHEIVNDVVGGVPVTVTYCPLCNTGAAFLRNFDGRTMDFGVSGMLRYSNLIMYDRQTETWWQQATGKGIAGRYAGGRLEILPILMLPWDEASSEYADAQVLSRETGFARSYGRNPYSGYDRSSRPFLYRGPEIDGQYDPMTRVVTLNLNGDSAAHPYPVLQEERVVNDRVGGTPVVVIWQAGTASPLDSSSVSGGRDVGTANAFVARADGRELSFELQDDDVVDTQTGSVWNANGRAVSGELEGSSLEPVPQIQHFWFSWTAFRPGE
jgi:hypothetical protein